MLLYCTHVIVLYLPMNYHVNMLWKQKKYWINERIGDNREPNSEQGSSRRLFFEHPRGVTPGFDIFELVMWQSCLVCIDSCIFYWHVAEPWVQAGRLKHRCDWGFVLSWVTGTFSYVLSVPHVIRNTQYYLLYLIGFDLIGHVILIIIL